MKRVNFENGKITQNILGVAMPMLVAQLISLLYNVIDRIYIARIPDVGTAALTGTIQGMSDICKGYCQSGNRWICDAAHKQPCVDML